MRPILTMSLLALAWALRVTADWICDLVDWIQRQ